MFRAAHRGLTALAALAAFLTTGGFTTARAGSVAGPFYQTFTTGEIDAFNASTGGVIQAIGLSATNIAAGNGMVFFEQGTNIDEANSELGNLSVFHADNNAPAGLALDASTGILYQTFTQGEVDAFNASTGGVIQVIGLSATNIVAGNGMVFFEQGGTIYEANSDLGDLHVFQMNSQAPTGLALDASTGILYETFGSGGIIALSATTGAEIASLSQSATNIAAADGMVFFEQGSTIFTTSSLLTDVSVFRVNNVSPAGLALAPAIASVPEPSTLALAVAALLCYAGRRALVVVASR